MSRSVGDGWSIKVKHCKSIRFRIWTLSGQVELEENDVSARVSSRSTGPSSVSTEKWQEKNQYQTQDSPELGQMIITRSNPSL